MRLKNLPPSLGDLKLETLDIRCAFALRDLPDSINNMTSLTEFEFIPAMFKVSHKAYVMKKHINMPDPTVHIVRQIENRGCSSLVELPQLTCHELDVCGLENVRHLEDATRAKMRDKSDLRELALRWGVGGEEDKALLERLVPPRSLEGLLLYGYMSMDFPNWMSDISSYLPSLTSLTLKHLGCDVLPPFGWLPNLRILILSNIPNIRKIGMECYGERGTYTKLRAITLSSIENLVEWQTTYSGEEDEEFLMPNLHYFNSRDCPKLKFLPYPPRSMLWRLDNSDDVFPVRGFGKFSSSTLPIEMYILNCSYSAEKWDRLQHFPTLETFHVQFCNGLMALPEVTRCFTSLAVLSLCSLEDLELLPEWLGHLTSIEDISIEKIAQQWYKYMETSEGKLFKLEHCWEMLKNCDKWKLIDRESPPKRGSFRCMDEDEDDDGPRNLNKPDGDKKRKEKIKREHEPSTLRDKIYAMVQSNEVLLVKSLRAKIELVEKKAREKQERWKLLKDVEERRARAALRSRP
ncbi:putative disease resistance protein RGA3 [Hordeum vulgare]|nr:putative disease resistance protein RGA3 [Hordeum vulgare]